MSGAVSDSGTVPGASSGAVLTEKRFAAEQRAQEKAFAKQMDLRKKRLAEKLAWAEQRLKAEAEMQELELKAQREMEQKQLANDQMMIERRLAAELEFLRKKGALKKQIDASKAKISALKAAEGKEAKLKPGYDAGKDSDDDDDSGSVESEESGSRHSKKGKQDGPGYKTSHITREQMVARNSISLKLPKFCGEPEVWPLFISSFEHTTAACGFSNLENLTRLMDALHGHALENVRSRLVYPDSVPEIIQDLRDLYGRPEKLMKTLLMKVRKAPAPQSDRLSTFIGFGIVVKQLCDHLEAAKMSDHLSNPMLVQELVEKLPPSYKMDWVRYRRGKVNSPLRMFTNFVKEIVADVSEVTDFSELSQEEPLIRKSSVHDEKSEGEVETWDDRASRKCWICERSDHLLRNCNNFSRMSLEEREDEVERMQLCGICLGKHGGMRCSSRRRCPVEGCGGDHHPLLHRADDPVRWREVRLNAQQDGDRSVLFRMVPVTLYAGSERLDTLAFLDEGSSTTLMEESVANRLRLDGEVEPLVVSWTGNVKRHEENSRKVRFALSAKRWHKRHGLRNVHTVRNLGLPEQHLEFRKFAEQYPWMANLEVDDYKMQRPTILIGLDNLHLFAPLDSRIGKPGDPIAVQTQLGWTVYGQLNGITGANAVVNLHSSGRALGTSGGAVSGQQPSPHRCRDGSARTEYSPPDVVGLQQVGVRWQPTEGRAARNRAWKQEKCNFVRQVRVNVHRTIIAERSADKEPKQRKAKLKSSVARKRGDCVKKITARWKAPKCVDSTDRCRQAATSKLLSNFAVKNAGAKSATAMRCRFQQKRKLWNIRGSVGRTVRTEERGRRNEGYVAMVGRCVGRTALGSEGRTTWAEIGELPRRRASTLVGRVMCGGCVRTTVEVRQKARSKETGAAGIRE